MGFSFGRAVHADDDGVVALVGLEGDLLQGLHLLGAHLLNLAGEHGLGLSGRVDAVSLRKGNSRNILGKVTAAYYQVVAATFKTE